MGQLVHGTARARDASAVATGSGTAAEVVAWLREHPALNRPLARASGQLPTGLAALDGLLGGGLPRGAITEVIGATSAGRTSLVLAVLAAATARRECVAWIDPHDALDPQSARAAGVLLERLLWVRPCGADNLPRALKAAELVLDAGGFGVLSLDLTGQRARGALLRSASWIRLGRRLEGSRTALVLLAPTIAAGSSAALRLECLRCGHGVQVRLLRQRGCAPGGTVRLPLSPPED
jgi:hypothetical protein